ncbi:hypothetical protein D1872_241570 [compost metagenome]
MIGNDLQEVNHMHKIVKRLPNTHHDNMAYTLIFACRIQMELNLHNLLRNFSGSQITALLKQSACAKAAANIAAYLSCNTDR